MLPQALHVTDFKSGLFGISQRRVDWHQLGIRKDIVTHKGRTLRLRLARTQSDTVVEENSVGSQQFACVFKIARELASTHVLEHADANQFVEAVAIVQVAVIAHFHPAPAIQAGPRYSLVSQLGLVATKRDAKGFYSVLLGGMDDQATPPAANVEQALARAQSQLAAQIARSVPLFFNRHFKASGRLRTSVKRGEVVSAGHWLASQKRMAKSRG